jgi:hypothetical protein
LKYLLIFNLIKVYKHLDKKQLHFALDNEWFINQW